MRSYPCILSSQSTLKQLVNHCVARLQLWSSEACPHVLCVCSSISGQQTDVPAESRARNLHRHRLAMAAAAEGGGAKMIFSMNKVPKRQAVDTSAPNATDTSTSQTGHKHPKLSDMGIKGINYKPYKSSDPTIEGPASIPTNEGPLIDAQWFSSPRAATSMSRKTL